MLLARLGVGVGGGRAVTNTKCAQSATISGAASGVTAAFWWYSRRIIGQRFRACSEHGSNMICTLLKLKTYVYFAFRCTRAVSISVTHSHMKASH